MGSKTSWDDWIAPRRQDLTDGSYGHELRFVEIVLSQVKDLSPASVTHQVDFKDIAGGDRRLDFVIDDGQMDRAIAIEVDGRDKTGKLPTHTEHDDFATRQNAVTPKYHLVRYTNHQVDKNPEELRKQIEKGIAIERANLLGRERRAPEVGARAGTEAATAEVQRIYAQQGQTNTPQGGKISISMDDLTPPVQRSLPTAGAVAAKPSSNTGVIAAGVAVALISVLFLLLIVSGSKNEADQGSRPPVEVPDTVVPPTTLDPRGVEPTGYQTCPEDYPFKGNQSGIYHSPGQDYYDRTDPEECFATAGDAVQAGYRASEV